MALIKGKVNFKLQELVLLDNFKQHLESFVWFPGMLCGKKEKPGNARDQQSFLNKKTLIVNCHQYNKTAKKLPICHLSTILALITRKATFKLQF